MYIRRAVAFGLSIIITTLFDQLKVDAIHITFVIVLRCHGERSFEDEYFVMIDPAKINM